MPTKSVRAKTVFVTGASSGIGRATAELLAGNGWRVAGSVRSPADGEALRAIGVAPIELDVTRERDLAVLAERLAHAFDTRPEELELDAVIQSAGVVEPGPLEFLTLEALRAQFEVNVVGVLGVAQATLPALRARGRATCVFISSISGRVAFPFEGAYNASKFALEGLADTLRLELAGSGVDVTLIEPGPVRTPIWKRIAARWNAKKGALPERAGEHYGARLEHWEADLAACAAGGVEPLAVAQVVQRALDAARPRIRYPVGPSARKFALALRIAPTRWLDRRIRRTQPPPGPRRAP